MLNRRSVRIRAMQAMYAYEKAKGANYQLGLERISQTFAPDLNSAERQDKRKLKGLEKLAIVSYEQQIKNVEEKDDNESIEEVDKVVRETVKEYHLNNKKNFEAIKRETLINSESVYQSYLEILSFYIELAKISKAKPLENQQSSLADNKIIQALINNEELETAILRKNASQKDNKVFLNKVYKEILSKKEKYLAYISKKNHTLEEDLAILKYILKNIFLKEEMFEEHFSAKNMFWIEDINTLRANINQTFSDFPETQKLSIKTLDDFWMENKAFLNDLLEKSWQMEEELEVILNPNLKNWEIDRIAELDRIILKLSLIELIHYPNIPVKVTINESLEIAKEYSTPKSTAFINGILDKVSKNLMQNGTIKKSGRGMLDNK